MATVPGPKAPGWLVWLQCPATWHQGGWDGNRAWRHCTREAGMATGPGHMAPGMLGWQQTRLYGYSARPQGWLGCQQGLAKRQQGGWDGNRAWPHATRETGMATGSGHMAPGWLGWLQCLATRHQGGLYGYSAQPHGTSVAGMATWPGEMAPGRLGWQQGLAT